jgi:hypothetical protein
MKIYQVDMRNGDANYAYLTLYLFTKSENKPTKSQIDKCLELDDEIDVNVLKNLNVLGIDDGMDINDFDFGLDQINEVNDKLIDALNPGEIFYIKEAFDPNASLDNILNENGKIILISSNGEIRHF